MGFEYSPDLVSGEGQFLIGPALPQWLPEREHSTKPTGSEHPCGHVCAVGRPDRSGEVGYESAVVPPAGYTEGPGVLLFALDGDDEVCSVPVRGKDDDDVASGIQRILEDRPAIRLLISARNGRQQGTAINLTAIRLMYRSESLRSRWGRSTWKPIPARMFDEGILNYRHVCGRVCGIGCGMRVAKRESGMGAG